MKFSLLGPRGPCSTGVCQQSLNRENQTTADYFVISNLTKATLTLVLFCQMKTPNHYFLLLCGFRTTVMLNWSFYSSFHEIFSSAILSERIEMHLKVFFKKTLFLKTFIIEYKFKFYSKLIIGSSVGAQHSTTRKRERKQINSGTRASERKMG